ncbi:MAG: chromate transporter, partial [Bradyrhizobium sp.]|nr:chromate transporter [Bradyrhizobium sp.]
PVTGFGLDFDAPVLASVDGAALLLSLAAAVAILRFKLGMMTVLGAACAAGVLLRLAGWS